MQLHCRCKLCHRSLCEDIFEILRAIAFHTLIFRPLAYLYALHWKLSLVIGMAGRLVRDKGHPIMFEALKQIFMEDEKLRKLFVLVAGDGPWGTRYRALGPNLLVLGPLEQMQLAAFYNALDIFANPTLRAQGMDHTLMEAMLSGKPLMATGFPSITKSVVVGPNVGYTFSPTVAPLKEALYRVMGDGGAVLEKKAMAARERTLKPFTATKMTAAYEWLFLCISKHRET